MLDTRKEGVCVCFYYCRTDVCLNVGVFGGLFVKDTEPSPLQDSSSVRQQGGLPGHPPVVPHPESRDAQAAYR